MAFFRIGVGKSLKSEAVPGVKPGVTSAEVIYGNEAEVVSD